MKTLILYASKYGAAGEIAQRIAKKLPEATVCHMKDDTLLKASSLKLADYDCIIIGSSLYAGMIRKEAKEYLAQHAPELCQRKLGLFLSGLAAENEQDYFKNNFSAELLEAATATAFLGGIFDPGKVGFLGRFMMKMVSKQSGYIDTISDEKINEFIEALENEKK